MANDFDVVIIGAGAAGLMCAAQAKGRSILVIDHGKTLGEKIRISGGGRCNFTNRYCGPDNFISNNRHFAKSALAGYTPQDFITLVDHYKIKWHEKTLGQLFCDDRSQQIIDMLRSECQNQNATIWLETEVLDVKKTEEGFTVTTTRKSINCTSLVVASGGQSIPKMGASGFAYKLAAQFDLPIVTPVAALVPLTFTDGLKADLAALSGVGLNARVSANGMAFDEALLFTHRGLSGPSILQISSYWQPGDQIHVDFAPGQDMQALLLTAKRDRPKTHPQTVLAQIIPKRLAGFLTKDISDQNLADLSHAAIDQLAARVHNWSVKPAGTEGFRTAEVTKGGVDTKSLSSKTMACRAVPGLYFIGECVDVTGQLGGHNFQWAWASAHACGQALI